MAGEADELRTLARQLEQVPGNAGPFLRKAVEVTARNVKDAGKANLDAAAGNSLRRTGYSVDYEVTGGRGVGGWRQAIEAEVGPNLGRGQGPMAGWFEDGAVDGVPGVKPMERAMRDNVEDFEKGIDIAIADALKAAGF